MLFMAGASGLFLTAFYVVLDVWKVVMPFQPLVWMGMNAILVFILAAWPWYVCRNLYNRVWPQLAQSLLDILQLDYNSIKQRQICRFRYNIIIHVLLFHIYDTMVNVIYSNLLDLSLTWIYYGKPENNIFHLLRQHLFIDIINMGQDMGLFVYVLAKIAFWYVVCWVLFKRKMFLKI